jgi:hypothetical protein
VDAGVRCPYGNPAGQYILRPESSCHQVYTQGNGCSVYQGHVVDPEVERAEKDDAIRENFETKSKTLTEVLGELADRHSVRTPKRLALELAVVVLSDSSQDIAVMTDEGLPKKK